MNKNYYIFVLVVLHFISMPLFATNYYVSTSGSFSNNGLTKDKPFKGLGQVPSALKPGDSILIKGGDKVIGGPLVISASGNSSSDIVVSSYDNILPSGETLNGGLALNGGITIDNASYVTIKDIILKGDWNPITMVGTGNSGVKINPTSTGGGSIAIIGCDISGFYIGVHGYYPSPVSSTNVFTTINVMYCLLHDNGKAGLDISAVVPAYGSKQYAFDNLILYKNFVYNNLGSNIANHSGDGAVVGSFERGIMSHNVVFHNGWRNTNAGAGPAGIWCWDADSMLLEYNEAYDNGTMLGKGDGDGFDFDGGVTNSILQYNYSHDNWAAGYLLWNLGGMRSNTSNNILRYNISENDNIGYPLHLWNRDHFGGIAIAAGCSDTKIYNNTISAKLGPCIKVEAGTTTNFEYYNNIFYSEAPSGHLLLDMQSSGNKLLNNCYYSVNGFLVKIGATTYSTFGDGSATDLKKSGNETSGNGMLANPKLKMPLSEVNVGDFSLTNFTNYQLQAGSPVKDKGLDLTASPYKWNIGKNDYNGLSIPAGSGHDIGACEAR